MHMQLMQTCTLQSLSGIITKEMFLSVTVKSHVHIKKSIVQVFLSWPTLKLMQFTPFLLSPKPANLDFYKHGSRIFLGKRPCKHTPGTGDGPAG